MKHVLKYTQKVNESIGKGSVLLIKGKPSDKGRFLYVTTITGMVEFKPGVRMVFLGDDIYRVKYKGDNKFSGIRVGYEGEEGLKGILNMKNPGRPSLVLNKNKTPYHWLTLKYDDIGTALREVGWNLMDHDLILESEEKEHEMDPILDWIAKEYFKLLMGEDSAIIPHKIIDDINDLDESETDNNESHTHYTEFIIEAYLNNDKIPEDLKDLAKKYDFYDGFQEEYGEDLMDMMKLEHHIFNIYISFVVNFSLKHSYDEGDRWTPSYTEVNIEGAEYEIENMSIEGDEVELKRESMKSSVIEFEKFARDLIPSEVVNPVTKYLKQKE